MPVSEQRTQFKISLFVTLLTGVASILIASWALFTSTKIENMDKLLANQQRQLNGQDSELKKLNNLQDTTTKQLSEIQKIEKSSTETADGIKKELTIISLQQKTKIKSDTLARRSNLIRLKYFTIDRYRSTQFKNVNIEDSLADNLNFLNDIITSFRDQLSNPILLEDDSLLRQFTYIIYKAQLLSREIVPFGGRYSLFYSFYALPYMGTQEEVKRIIGKNYSEFAAQLSSTVEYTFNFINREFSKLSIPIEPLQRSMWNH